MNINQALQITANALVKENSKTEVSIIPKYLKAGLITEDIKFTDYKVLMLIYEYTNTSTGMCYPTQEKIAQDLSNEDNKVYPGTISKSLKKLEQHGFIHCVPARQYTKNGKPETASSFILITPFAKIKDADFHKEMTDMINSIKYVVVDCKDGQRAIIGNGAHTGSKTQNIVNEYREQKRQEAIQTIKVTENIKLSENDIKEIDNLVDLIVEEYTMECNPKEIKKTLKEIVGKRGSLNMEIHDLINEYESEHGILTADTLVDIFNRAHN